MIAGCACLLLSHPLSPSHPLSFALQLCCSLCSHPLLLSAALLVMQPQQQMNVFPLPILPDDQLEAPTAVQRWGAVLVCEMQPWSPSPVIVHCSENVQAVLGLSVAQLLLRPLDSALLLDSAACSRLVAEAARRRHSDEIYAECELSLLPDGRRVHLVLHQADDGRFVCDALPVLRVAYSGEDVADSEEELSARLRAAVTTAQCWQAALDGINRLLQYDRCIVYRCLAPHGHAEVVAESLLTAPCAPLPAAAVSSLPLTMPFLGLRFPPHPVSDRAQRVHRKARLLLVQDAMDTGAALVTSASLASSAFSPRLSSLLQAELAFSLLRAVSPRQAEQFLAIGVRAAASFTVLVKGRCWGTLLWSDAAGRAQRTADAVLPELSSPLCSCCR